MELTIEVGNEEKHQLHLSFDQVLGHTKIEVDGKAVAHDWRSFSIHRNRRYEFSIGRDESHDVIVEVARKALVAGFRSQTCRVLVDEELVGTYVGRATGRTSKAA